MSVGVCLGDAAPRGHVLCPRFRLVLHLLAKRAGFDLLWYPQSLCFHPFERVNPDSPEVGLQGLLRLKPLLRMLPGGECPGWEFEGR